MAIDTAEKRRSAAGVGFLPLTPGVTPNAAKDVEWRQQSAWSYSGIAPAGPGPEPTPARTNEVYRKHVRYLRKRQFN